MKTFHLHFLFLGFFLLLIAAGLPLLAHAQNVTIDIPPQGVPTSGYYGDVPITDIPMRSYHDGVDTGGLYGNWQNGAYGTQLTRINAAVAQIKPLTQSGSAASSTCTPGSNCAIVMMNIGHSISECEWAGVCDAAASLGLANPLYPSLAQPGTFLWYLGRASSTSPQPSPAPPPPYVNPQLYVMNLAVSSQQANVWENDISGFYAAGLNNILSPAWQPTYPLDTQGVSQAAQYQYQTYSCGAQIVDNNAPAHVQKITSCGGSCPNHNLCDSGETEPTFSTSGGSVTDDQITWTDQGVYANQFPQLTDAQVQVIYTKTIMDTTQQSFPLTCSGVTVTGGTTVQFSAVNPPCIYYGRFNRWINWPITIGNTTTTIQSTYIIGNNGYFTVSPAVSNSATSWSTADYSGTEQTCVPGSINLWVSTCELLTWENELGTILRFHVTEYPNLKLDVLGADPYTGYCIGVSSCKRMEPWGDEDWYGVQKVLMDQSQQMDSLTPITSCSVGGGVVTINTAGLPASLTTGITAAVHGNSNKNCNTSVIGDTITVSGNSFTFTQDPSSTPAGSGQGNASWLPDANVGSLDSADGIAAVLAIGPYEWTSGNTARSDGFQWPCEASMSDHTHESAFGYATTADTACTGIHGSNAAFHTTKDSGTNVLAAQQLNFWTDCTSQDGCTPVTGTAYAFGPVDWTKSWFCATGHQDAGCE